MPRMKPGKDEVNVCQKKKGKRKKGIGLNKVFLPSPFLPGVAALLCLFILNNLSLWLSFISSQ